MTRVELRRLTVIAATERGSRTLVHDVGLSVEAGGLLGIVGETGAGKTMTSRALLGLLPPNVRAAGSLVLDDEVLPIGGAATRARLGRDLAVVLQHPMTALNPLARVRTQLVEGVRHLRLLDDDAALLRARELLARLGFPNPDEVLGLYPHQLSGGMAQRVTIGAALMSHPKVLVVDEPTSALDATVRIAVLRLLRELAREQRAAVVLVSHDLALVGRFCDRLLVMHDGRVVEAGPTDRVFGDPQQKYTRMLLSAAIGPDARRRCPLPVRGAAAARSAGGERPVAGRRPAQRTATAASSAPALEVDDVSRRYAGMASAALEPISLRVDAGQTVAIVGESGAGKSTLARIIAGLEAPNGGRVLVDGSPHRLRAGRRSPVQMVFQHPLNALNPLLPIGVSVGEPLAGARRRERAQRVADALAAVGIDPDRRGQRPSAFSGGQLQRIVIARALAAEPSVLVCDEPTSALDVSVQAQVLNLLLRLQDERGFACVLVTHDLGVVRVLADEVVVLRQGAVVERGPADPFFDGPAEAYSRALLDAGGITPRRAPRPSLDRPFHP